MPGASQRASVLLLHPSALRGRRRLKREATKHRLSTRVHPSGRDKRQSVTRTGFPTGGVACALSWWGRRDSNPHALRHMILSHARLPVPTLPLADPATLLIISALLPQCIRARRKVPFDLSVWAATRLSQSICRHSCGSGGLAVCDPMRMYQRRDKPNGEPRSHRKGIHGRNRRPAA